MDPSFSSSPPASAPASAHAALRAATSDGHRRVDAVFGRCALDDAEDYARFLAAHAAVVLPLEQALDEVGFAAACTDWPVRRRAAALRADRSELPAVDIDVPVSQWPDLGVPAAAWGAAYVLEGSRLGGRVLARSVAADLPRRYLAAAAGDWRGFLQALDAALPDGIAQARAIAAAIAVFDLFEAAGRAALEARVDV